MSMSSKLAKKLKYEREERISQFLIELEHFSKFYLIDEEAFIEHWFQEVNKVYMIDEFKMESNFCFVTYHRKNGLGKATSKIATTSYIRWVIQMEARYASN